MITNTKALFAGILKRIRPSVACDIGSRDGAQSMLLRHLLPQAEVWAFEANPINFAFMSRNKDLRSANVRLFPQAVSEEDGTATFHITDVDYEKPGANTGTSSLLIQEGRKVKEAVKVETRRLDSLVRERCPKECLVALWIDVEGAEYGVLKGIEGVADRVVAIHVEAAERPKWNGQKPLSELSRMMEGMGFVLCGSNITPQEGWGDVVFINKESKRTMGLRLKVVQGKAYMSRWFHADLLAVVLKGRAPWLYRFLRRIYLRFGT